MNYLPKFESKEHLEGFIDLWTCGGALPAMFTMKDLGLPEFDSLASRTNQYTLFWEERISLAEFDVEKIRCQNDGQ